MALDFQFPASQPLKSGLQQVVPLTINTQLKSAPQTVQVDIAWSEYGASSSKPVAVAVDLTGSASPGPALDAIRSVYIDNSFSFVPIYVKFPGTNFIAICPANSVAMLPVLVSPGVKQAIVYAQDFDDSNIPVTTIHFMNIEVAGWIAGTGEFTPPVAQASIVNTALATGAASNTLTAAGAAIGTPDATRVIYVLAYGRQNVGSGLTITGVTIGGVAATLIQQFTSSNAVVGLYALVVPAAAAAAITATFSAACSAAVAVFAAYNLTTPVAAFNSQHSTGAIANPSVTLLTSVNGVALSGAMVNAGSGFTGIGNVQTFTLGGYAAFFGCQVTNGANLNISAVAPASNEVLLASSFK